MAGQIKSTFLNIGVFLLGSTGDDQSQQYVLEFPFAFARVDEMSHDAAQIGYREPTAVKPLAPNKKDCNQVFSPHEHRRNKQLNHPESTHQSSLKCVKSAA